MDKFFKGIRIFLGLLFLFLGPLIVIIYSQFDYKIYNFPQTINGVMDFYECDEYNKRIKIPVSGDVEFYYNKWIVTDNELCEPDSYMRLPSRWSNSLVNDEIYSKTGYCSYKLTLKNLKPGSQMTFNIAKSTIPINCFCNGTLVGYIGNPKKDSICKVSELKDYKYDYYIVPDDGVVEIVFETGLTNYGGFYEAPSIILDRYEKTYISVLEFLPGIALGLLFFAIIIGLFISFYEDETRRFFMVGILSLILIHFMFSYELMMQYRLFNIYGNEILFQVLSFISMSIFNIYLFDFFTKEKFIIIKSKIIKYIFIIFLILLCILYPFFVSKFGCFIIWLLFMLVNFPILIMCFKYLLSFHRNYIYVYLYISMYSLSFLEMIEFTDLSKISIFGFASDYVLVICMSVIVYYARRLLYLNRSEKKKNELEIESLKLRQEVLLNQIKPHFIYNSLGAIMSLYHKNLKEGDEGLIIFSNYLRTNVDSVEKGLVPFSDEIDTVINYVELENLRFEKKFELLLELDFEDFMIPILSLQPIIENSIKYSGVNEKSDGYIKITSKLIDGFVEITVSNNGIPFNVDEIKVNSKGISNIKSRLKIFLDASFSVESNEKETKAIIRFKQID